MALYCVTFSETITGTTIITCMTSITGMTSVTGMTSQKPKLVYSHPMAKTVGPTLNTVKCFPILVVNNPCSLSKYCTENTSNYNYKHKLEIL